MVIAYDSGMDVYRDTKQIKTKYGKNFGKPGSELTFELNFKKQQLICYVDGENCGVALDNIVKNDKTKYKLAVSFYFKDAAIQIQDFVTHPQQEEKSNVISSDIYQKDYGEDIALQNAKILSLTQELDNKNMIISQMQKQQTSMQQNISSLTQQLTNATSMISQLQSQQKKVESYIFDDKKEHDNNPMNITNITTELLAVKKQIEMMQIKIDNIKGVQG